MSASDIALLFAGLWALGYVMTAMLFIGREWPPVEGERWIWVLTLISLCIIWPWALSFYWTGGKK